MRKLMWFTIGFAGACGFWAWASPNNWLLPLLICAVIGIFFSLISRNLKPMEMICFGCVVGFCWFAGFRQLYLSPALEADGKTLPLTVTVSDYSYETNYGIAADGYVELGGKQYQIRFYVNEETEFSPGDEVSGTFEMRYTPNDTHHAGKGIFLLGYQRGECTVEKGNADELRFFPAVSARRIKDRLRQLFPADVFSFTQALLLGDSTELSYEIDTAFKLSGIRHIIAVSGLHVMILYTVLRNLVFKNRILTALLCLPVLLLFAALAGFTPSVNRACIMVALMVLAQLLNRQYDSATALAFSALVMLLVNPLVITSVSFQLTVGCVAGILLFGEPIGTWLKSKMGKMKGKGIVPTLKRGFASSVSISLGAMSLTTPLCAYYFGTVSLFGILTNLVTLWLVHLIFLGLILCLLVSYASLGVAAGMASLLTYPIRWLLNTALWLGGMKYSAVYTSSPYTVAWLVFVYVLLILFLLSRNRRPGLLIGCIVLSLCTSLWATEWEAALGENTMTMLDVGQGQSILLRSGNSLYLVDCGGDTDDGTADVIAGHLLSRGIDHLDGIILTHMDRDHAGALENLLTRIEADAVYYPATAETAPDCAYSVSVTDDRKISVDGGEITIFGPANLGNDNENSLCVLFDTENCDILITGDRSSLGEMVLVYEKQLSKVDVLVAGHHGSDDATSELLLDSVRPAIVCISAGEDNSFGHPGPELLKRLETRGCKVFRTDLNGTITFRR